MNEVNFTQRVRAWANTPGRKLTLGGPGERRAATRGGGVEGAPFPYSERSVLTDWKHTLAMIAAFAVVTACMDEPEVPIDDPEMLMEVAITDEGVLALTEASAEQLEEAVLSAGGMLDRPLRLRVSGTDGIVLREVAAESYHDLLTTIAQQGVVNAAEIEREMEGLLAAIASGEFEVDLSAWREAAGELRSVFESMDSLRFIDAERKAK